MSRRHRDLTSASITRRGAVFCYVSIGNTILRDQHGAFDISAGQYCVVMAPLRLEFQRDQAEPVLLLRLSQCSSCHRQATYELSCHLDWLHELMCLLRHSPRVSPQMFSTSIYFTPHPRILQAYSITNILPKHLLSCYPYLPRRPHLRATPYCPPWTKS